MDRHRIEKILQDVRDGKLSVNAALEQVRLDPIERLGYANLDLHRSVRRGFPEVIFGPGKTPEQIAEIAGCLHRAGQTVLVTRVEPQVFEAIAGIESGAEYHPLARAVTLRCGTPPEPRPGITLITAGTSDRAVAEEAIVTAELMGNRVERIFDAGVAGLHRLLEHDAALQQSNVIIAVAGMEGALPTVVAGLTACPVVAVPTSVGYGYGSGGQAALMAMLNSCAGGVTVVNIDNGFGAGFAASLINQPHST